MRGSSACAAAIGRPGEGQGPDTPVRQVGGRRHGCQTVITEQPTQRRSRPGQPGRLHLRRRRHRPHLRDGPADHGGGKATEQRSDIEGGTSTGQASDIEGSSFLGAEGSTDTSSELIEDEDASDFAKDGQGTTE